METDAIVDIKTGGEFFCIEMLSHGRWILVGEYTGDEMLANDEYFQLTARNPTKRYRMILILFEPKRIVIR